MPSIEQSVKAQFAKVFQTSDWHLFKSIAEANLRDAARVKKADMPIELSLQLLARNCRKRLLIGVGIELLLKAVYLKNGYCINKPRDASGTLRFPFHHVHAIGTTLVDDKTFQLNELLQHLSVVLQMQNQDVTLKGLKIAKVFRNKEGHGVTASHAFDASNYRDIERSLVELYRDAFAEKLSVRFSLAPNEFALWRISCAKKLLQSGSSGAALRAVPRAAEQRR
jgi:hypothetical protein